MAAGVRSGYQDKCQTLLLYKKPAGTTFAEYLHEVKANAVLVSNKFRNYSGVHGDLGFAGFEREPASYGFHQVMSKPRYAFYLKVPISVGRD